MKKRLKHFINQVLFWSGISPLLMSRVYGAKKRYLVLLYHRVRTPENDYEPSVSPANFDKQLAYLARFFEPISLSELVSAIQTGEKRKRPLMSVTFDDGFRDNYETALPILKKHAVPAVIFVACGCLEDAEPMWTSRVEAMFLNASKEPLEINVNHENKIYDMASAEKRLKSCQKIKHAMKHVPDLERNRILQVLETKMGRGVDRANPIYSEMLSWEQLRVFSKEPLIEIGSHSVSHRMLAQLNAEEVDFEMRESKAILERDLKQMVRYMSYPGNSCNERVSAAAQAAGYEAAFRVDRDLNESGASLFGLKRMHVEDGSVEDLLAELSFCLPFLRKIVRSLRAVLKGLTHEK